MLIELSIENFAIIDRLQVRFDRGFTVLTGETGAGKSIIIDALQIALGARVSSDVVRGDARYASIEAIFEFPVDAGPALQETLHENGVEVDDTLILRREVQASGRSTARVNGRAVPLAVLSAVGSFLVDIHGQSDHLSILKRDRQLEMLDRFGDLLPLRSRAGEEIRLYAQLQSQHLALVAGQREAERRLDLLRFQVQEIESANLSPDEEDELAAERVLLANAEKLAQLAGSAYDSLSGEAVSGALASAALAGKELAEIDAAMQVLSERMEAAHVEVEDIAQELRHYRDSVDFDPPRLDDIEERLDLLNRLKRKYGPEIRDVVAFGERARLEMEDVENLDQRIRALEEEASAAEGRAGALAFELSAARARAAENLGGLMREALQGLGLKNTSFDIEISRHEAVAGLPVPGAGARYAYSQSGIDTVVFVVSFNPGEPLRPLDRVASGGETSRFLLALKSVLARVDRTPTLVFDEVDVGVGGRAGTVVGERLLALSSDHQVVSITHLPQVAALADEHLSVVKVVVGGRTSTDVRTLIGPARIDEIAHMMSGTASEAARRSAQELLESAHPGTTVHARAGAQPS